MIPQNEPPLQTTPKKHLCYIDKELISFLDKKSKKGVQATKMDKVNQDGGAYQILDG